VELVVRGVEFGLKLRWIALFDALPDLFEFRVHFLSMLVDVANRGINLISGQAEPERHICRLPATLKVFKDRINADSGPGDPWIAINIDDLHFIHD
jgi:hypothetical protein